MSLITVSSEDTGFPKENLIDGDYSAPFRFLSLLGGTIEIDFLTTITFDTIFIGNHNFDPSVTVEIRVGASSPPTTLVDSPAYRAKNMVSKLTPQSFRYLEISVADANSGLTEIGELVVGNRTILPRGIRFGFTPGIQQETIRERTNRGKRWALELFQLERRQYSFRFPESERAQFLAFWTAVNGSLDPFVWIENETQEDPAEALFVSLETEGFDPSELDEPSSDPVFDWDVTMIEEGLGGEIAL